MPERAYSSWRSNDCGQGSFSAVSASQPSNSDSRSTTPMAPTVADVMSRQLDFCTPDCSVQAIACIMADKNVGTIPVVDNTDHMVPIGIVTDRDIVTRVIAPGQDPCAIRVDQCMSLDIQTIASNAPVSEAMGVMQHHQLRRLPVVDDTGCLVGILSHSDLTRPANPAQNAETIRELSEPVA